MKVITIASLKGGVGKTTLAIFLSQSLSINKRVLLIDADPNNNATDFFLRTGDVMEIENANLYHALSGKRALADCIHPTEFNLSVIPSTPGLHRVGVELGTNPGAMLRFVAHLQKLPFDYAVIDTPPAIGFELRAALHAADLILSPVHPSRWALQALDILRDEIETVKEGMGKDLPLLVVPSIVTAKEAEALQVAIPEISKTAILKSGAVKKSGSTGKPLSEKIKSWNEFQSLAGEVA